MSAPAHLLLGGTGGIGSALARRLVATGARVTVVARDRGRLDALAAELGVRTAVADASRPEEIERVSREALEAYGRLDGLACLVGSILLKPAHLTTEDDWAETMTQNLGTAFAAVRAASRVMRAAGGSVVLMSSAAARVGLPNHEAISAAKAGVIGLALSAAASYAGARLRFNVVAPGLVRTPLSARLTANEASLKASTAMHPLGRIGEPDEVASLVEWLLDPRNGWITGQVIGADGGLATVRGR